MAIALGDNIKLALGLPTDARYFSTITNKPWTGVTEVNTALLGGVGGVRYTGLTVNIGGVEYWYKDGIGDGDLILKTTGGGSATSGENVTKEVTQASHGFNVKDFIGWSGGTYNKAIANGLYDGEFIGLVTEVPDSGTFKVTQSGYVTGLTGLVSDTTYFLSESTAGLITSTEPTGDTQISKAVLIANSTTSGWVLPYAGYVITTGGTGGGNLNWQGTTVGGIGTYVDEFTICAQSNLKYDGTNLCLLSLPAKTTETNILYIGANGSVVTGATSSSAASGEQITKLICQVSHGFAVKDVIGWSGGTYNKAIADGTYDGEILGIVSSCLNTDCFNLTQAGYVTGLTSLSQNSTYFLSDSTAGLMTTTAPTTAGHIVKSVLIADSTTSAWVLPYAGYQLSVSSGTSSMSEFTITGNSSTTGFTINHGLGKQFVNVQIVKNTAPYPTVYTNVERPNDTCVYVTFDDPPTTGQEFKILIIN